MDTNVYSLVQSQRITADAVTECELGKQSAPAFQRHLIVRDLTRLNGLVTLAK